MYEDVAVKFIFIMITISITIGISELFENAFKGFGFFNKDKLTWREKAIFRGFYFTLGIILYECCRWILSR
jgi:hypothetical protein